MNFPLLESCFCSNESSKMISGNSSLKYLSEKVWSMKPVQSFFVDAFCEQLLKKKVLIQEVQRLTKPFLLVTAGRLRWNWYLEWFDGVCWIILLLHNKLHKRLCNSSAEEWVTLKRRKLYFGRIKLFGLYLWFFPGGLFFWLKSIQPTASK